MSGNSLSLRSLIGAVALLFLGASAQAPEITLRQASQSAEILIGTAVRPAHLSEPDYVSTLAREYNMAEPEDALKWEIIHPERDHYDFSQADRVVDFATSHGMKVRGHTLVWHKQNPKWLTDGNFNSAELGQILEQHIKTVVGHYRGRVFAWDVVNEAYDEIHPGTIRNTIWSDHPGIGDITQTGDAKSSTSAAKQRRDTSLKAGYEYIERCFRWAHEADREALLFYNEAEAEEMNPKSDAIYAMAGDFRRRGVPIDGVGFQMHVAKLHADINSIATNIERFTALGIQVHITELDVALPVDSNGSARVEDLERQASIYREIAKVCLSHPGCTAIQTWGFTDKYSWISSHSKNTEGAALPFDRNYRAKAAYRALLDELRNGRGNRSR